MHIARGFQTSMQRNHIGNIGELEYKLWTLFKKKEKFSNISSSSICYLVIKNKIKR